MEKVLELFKDDVGLVGYVRITNKIEFSLDKEIRVDYEEGICEKGMALKWDWAVVRGDESVMWRAR